MSNYFYEQIAIAEKATSGPWEVMQMGDDWLLVEPCICSVWNTEEANAVFIANSGTNRLA